MHKILYAIEAQHEAGAGPLYNLAIAGHSMAVVAEHCELLFQAGHICQYDSEFSQNRLCGFCVGKLTNAGHDYIETLRNGTTGAPAKN